MESPEYMDIEGFEGFFHETTERRMVEFTDFILDSDDFDAVDGKLDSASEDGDSEMQEDNEDEELLLLQEILSLKVGTNGFCRYNKGFAVHQCGDWSETNTLPQLFHTKWILGIGIIRFRFLAQMIPFHI